MPPSLSLRSIYSSLTLIAAVAVEVDAAAAAATTVTDCCCAATDCPNWLRIELLPLPDNTQRLSFKQRKFGGESLPIASRNQVVVATWVLPPASCRLVNLPNREYEGGQSKDWRGEGGC